MIVLTYIRRVVGAAVLAAALAAPAFAQPAIWRVSDADSEIYLFGTVHILRPELDWRAPDIMAAFDSADTVYFEAPVQDPQQAAAMMGLVQRFGLNPPGRPLSAQLSEESNALLQQVGAQVGMPAVMLEPMRPWLAGVTIAIAHITAQGYDPNSGVEMALWPLARDAGKDLAYFETIEEQLGFFADLPEDVEVAFLESSLQSVIDDPDMLDGLVDAWASGDVAAIDRMMNGDFREDAPEVYEILIVRRNENWADQIAELMEGSGVVFIAVGAGHLAGDVGVPQLLRTRGFTVEGP